MSEKSPYPKPILISANDINLRRKAASKGSSLSTILCVSLCFVCAILLTAVFTYSLTYDAYYVYIQLGRAQQNETPSHPIPAKPDFPIIPVNPASNDFKAGYQGSRIPTALKAIQYLVKLQPFIEPEDNFVFLGYERFTFIVMEETNQVIFHLNNITIDEDTIMLSAIDGSSTENLTFSKIEYDPDRQFFLGTLDDPLEVDVTYNMTMNYTGYLNDDLGGFYRSVYQHENGNDELLATTQFESTDARRAFPCFDEPALKARFEIHIMREGTLRRSISNMPRSSTFQAEAPWKDWYWDIFDNTLPMSTYLVAFVVSDFSYKVSDENDHVTFRVWAREAALYQADYALDIGPEVLTYYEGFFNIPFPLPKQDMVAIPDFSAGAMENWGLVTYRETALLLDEQYSSAANKQRVAQVVAHELAHQWFGDLVSPSWWTYIWLNEGFASYMEFYGVDAVEATWMMLEQSVIDNNLHALSVDCLESSRPISINVTSPEEISQMFDDITYNKGGAIIRMMEFFLTTDTFRAGITDYLTALAFSSATQDDLWYYLTEQGHDDGTLPDDLTVKMIMDTWTTQMGYPVLNVTRSRNGRTATITQERFLLAKNDSSTDTHNYMWWVPLTFTTEDNPDFTDTTVHSYMTDSDESVDIDVGVSEDMWVIFNIKSANFYRVNYDLTNWNLIITQLDNSYTGIALINRAQIIDDSLSLARGGVLSYDVPLELCSYLQMETEYVAWSAALNNLEYLEEMFTRTAGYGAMKDYLLTVLIPSYNTLGFDDSLNDAHLEQLSRALILGETCHLEYGPCVDSSTALFAEWMDTEPLDEGLISPNLKSTVYCTGIAEGSDEEWDFAYNVYLTSNLGTDKDYLLSALGCSKDIWILSRYLEMAFTEEYGIRKQDAYKVFDSVAENDIGRDIAWEYLVENWNDIAEYYGSQSSCAGFASDVSVEFNTQEKLIELIALNEYHSDDLGSATDTMDQAIENVRNNIAWMDNYYSIINQWLIDEGYGDLGNTHTHHG